MTNRTNRPRPRFGVATLALIASAGCGRAVFGTEPDSAPPDPFPPANGAGVVITTDASSRADADVDGASPFIELDGSVRSNDTRSGVITISHYRSISATWAVARAWFDRRETDSICPMLSDGAFLFADCPLLTNTEPDVTPLAHAGAIAIYLALSPSPVASLSPTLIPAGEYEPVDLPEAAVAAGSEVRVSAMGAEVPAFEARALIPLNLEFRLESPADGRVDVARDLVVRWNHRAGARVSVFVVRQYVSNGVEREAYVRGSFDGSEGTGTIPPRVLRRLAAEGRTVLFYAYATVENRTNVQAGPWPIIVRATRTESTGSLQLER